MKDSQNAISQVLDATRRKLLETGTRNRLIHVNRANQRSNSLNIINELTEETYGLLRVQSKRMRFKGMGKDKQADGDEMLLASPEDDLEAGSERHTDNFLETPLGPEALARRLLKLHHAARTAEEEQGLNILFLAMGFLRWKESDSSEIVRDAPLILLPVELVRNERSATFDIRVRDDDITTNLPLQERMRQDFGMSLPEIEDGEDWSPSEYLASVEDAVSGQKGWSVDRDGMQLGFFSFAKLLMHRDLAPENWPNGSMAANDLLSGLLTEGFEAEEPIFTAEDKLDTKLDPAEIIQVIDADASQTKVIEEVRRGKSLVVQGPPGTGKSQTITNIIAAAAHDGKTVLFVAEKMAALTVVHDRLVKSGLRDICLELHSRTANKKALAQELGRTLMASARPVPPAADAEQLRLTRDELNSIATLLHEPLNGSGVTPFRAMSEIIGFIGKGATPPSIPEGGLDTLSAEQRKRALAAIGQYVEALERSGDPGEHPFRGTEALDLQPPDLARLETELANAVAEIQGLLALGEETATSLHVSTPRTLEGFVALSQTLSQLAQAPEGAATSADTLFDRVEDPRLGEALEAGKAWTAARQLAEAHFASTAWDADLGTIRAGIVRGQTSFFARIFGPYRRSSASLAALLKGAVPKDPVERLRLVDQLGEVQTLRKRLGEEESWLQSALGEVWRGERTPFEALKKQADWLLSIRATGKFQTAKQLEQALLDFPEPDEAARRVSEYAERTQAVCSAPLNRLNLDLQEAGLSAPLTKVDLAELSRAFEQMRDAPERYSEWASLGRTIAQLNENGAGAIVDGVNAGRIEPKHAQTEFSYACAEASWNAARRERPELNRLPSLDRHDLVSLFRGLEKDRVETAKNLVLSRHFEQMPKGTMGEMGIIRGEIARKRGHKSIRWVMKNAGSMVQRIKPVMLMSPISVAQFIPPGAVNFDLLVIDEASQIRPEDALGVIARAKQIVVVGDQKQLPPTSFFDRLVDDAEEDDEENGGMIGANAADMESILSLCDARGLRSRMLEWHYRSRDPSLIQVSNAEFYDDNLVLPPSPLQLDDNYGLKFRRVPGVYARGGNGLGRQGTNKIEAQEVVKAVASHAQNWPDLSLGIVTFSKAQADMMTEILELERRKDPILDAFLREGQTEDIFVKNIENVQGDERDVIFISVGYGPQEPNGRLASMSFGPVNGEGGERRLNVLFSRARVRCEVFASFDPGDIDPSRTSRDGPRVLKRFLEFAKSGQMEERISTGLEADSPFEEDVGRVIEGLGYLADPQVGTAGFRIDLGVRHPEKPGQYLLAVECDGAAYHSALWARERDRLRQEVLENLGWTFHRIWSTDWFHNREREITRLRTALDKARLDAAGGISVRGSNSGASQIVEEKEEPETAEIEIAHLELKAPAYQRADINVQSKMEPHEAPLEQLADLIRQIVEIEGPIHIVEVARRVSAAFGKSRTGRRIMEATTTAVQHAKADGIMQNGDFLMTPAQSEHPPVRDRRDEAGGILKATYLPPMEIKAASAKIIEESGVLTPEEMTRAVARLLGFQRVGPDLSEAILNEL
jgi:hypothetical protein